MIILVDTREKVNDHIISSFEKNGISYKKKALEYGDYSFALPKNETLSIPRDMYFNKKVCIERKASLEEISGNLTKERDRFEKELSLAPKEKVLLIENANYSDVANGLEILMLSMILMMIQKSISQDYVKAIVGSGQAIKEVRLYCQSQKQMNSF